MVEFEQIWASCRSRPEPGKPIDVDGSLNNSSNEKRLVESSKFLQPNHTTPPYLHCTCMETGTVLERGGTPESIALKSIGNDIKKKSPQNSNPKNSNLREELDDDALAFLQSHYHHQNHYHQ